jgi:hypothetical protein
MTSVEHVCKKCPETCGCMFCDGGLFLCDVCGSFEGATTTECPGCRMTPRESDAVYAGRLDFIDGAWKPQASGSAMSHFTRGQDGRVYLNGKEYK